MYYEYDLTGHVFRSIRESLSTQLTLLQHVTPIDMSGDDVVEPGDPRHLLFGVECELEQTLRHLEEFLAKYAAAQEADAPCDLPDF